MLLRLVVLILYGVAFVALRTYLRDHPPRFKGVYVKGFKRLAHALARMWCLLLWPLPGLLWIGMTSTPVWIIVGLSIFIPLDIFLLFLTVIGVTIPSSRSILDWLLSWMSVVLPLFVTLLIFVALLRNPFEFWQLTVFLTFVTFPPALAVTLVAWVVPDMIPTDPEQPGRAFRALQHFTGFFTTFPKPSWIVEDGEVKTRIKGNPFFGVGPGWLMTEPENLVVLKNGSGIARIVQPGVVFTEFAESPYRVVDLRNQIRIARVDARTQDGIEVNLPISSLFHIDPGYRKITLNSLANGEPWPIRHQRDIYQIVFYEEVDPTGKTPLEANEVRPWDDIPIKAAVNRVKQVIPEYSLEQLYSIIPDTATLDPKTGKIIPETGDLTRPTLGKVVREFVRNTVEPLGFHILGGGIGSKIVPTNPDVVNQRVEAWKASWISKVMDWQTEAQVQNLRDLSRIRSDARVDLLTQILEQTTTQLEDANNASRYVAYHLLENLLHLARNSQVREMLPESALQTLTQLQELTIKEE